MKTNKKTYELPQVTRIELDSDISLTLDSSGSPTPVLDPENLSPDPFSSGQF
jgi:hypothetical protein